MRCQKRRRDWMDIAYTHDSEYCARRSGGGDAWTGKISSENISKDSRCHVRDQKPSRPHFLFDLLTTKWIWHPKFGKTLTWAEAVNWPSMFRRKCISPAWKNIGVTNLKQMSIMPRDMSQIAPEGLVWVLSIETTISADRLNGAQPIRWVGRVVHT